MRIARLAFLIPLAFSVQGALACYTVYDRDDRVVYQSERSPVDMSRPLHETLPERFPGGHMVFDGAAECQVINSVATGPGGRNMSTASPLLTDERTAQALRLPHQSLGRGIALVAPGEVRMPPGVSLVPDTRYLGGPRRR